MIRDQLYLIRPDFLDQGKGPYFCPGCAQMVGLLDYYPTLKQHVDVCLVDFQRPRPVLVKLLGEENQSCPVLILGAKPEGLPAGIKVLNANGHYFIDDVTGIANYLAHACSTGIPH
jgi:hypothetical protein